MKRGQSEIHSDQLAAGVNGCIHLLEQTLKLSPPQMVLILQEAAAFVSKRHGIFGVDGATHVDTGASVRSSDSR